MAEPISYEIVTETWQRMAETPPEQAQGLIDQMEKEQPIIMVYLLALDEYPFNQTEREIIFYIGVVLWEILKQGQPPLSMVNEESISKVEEENFRFLELLSNDTEADFMSATRSLIDNYGEPEVLRYLVEALMEDEVDLDEYEHGAVDDQAEEVGLPEKLTPEEAAALFTSGDGITMDDIEVDLLDDNDEGEEELLSDLDDDENLEEEDDWLEFNIRPEFRGLAFVHLKTVLDAFIASRG